MRKIRKIKKDKRIEIKNCDVSPFINRLIRLRSENMNSLLNGMFFSSDNRNIDHRTIVLDSKADGRR